MRNVEHTIIDLIRRYGLNPTEINEGYCIPFARDLAETLEGSQIYTFCTMEFPGLLKTDNFCHAFTFYDGRFYDAESPRGVEDYRDLLFFAREKRSSVTLPEFDSARFLF